MVVGNMDKDELDKNHFVRTQADTAGKKVDNKSSVVESSVDVCVWGAYMRVDDGK